MILYGFELIKFNRYGKKGFKLRFIADGYCIEERKYYGDFSNFFIDGLKIKLMKCCNYLSTGNYEEPIKQVTCFEIVENAGENNDSICIRYIKNGRCVANSMLLPNVTEREELLIINNLKFLCRLNYKISKHMVMEAKKKGLMPPEGTSYLDMQRKIKKLIS